MKDRTIAFLCGDAASKIQWISFEGRMRAGRDMEVDVYVVTLRGDTQDLCDHASPGTQFRVEIGDKGVGRFDERFEVRVIKSDFGGLMASESEIARESFGPDEEDLDTSPPSIHQAAFGLVIAQIVNHGK